MFCVQWEIFVQTWMLQTFEWVKYIMIDRPCILFPKKSDTQILTCYIQIMRMDKVLSKYSKVVEWLHYGTKLGWWAKYKWLTAEWKPCWWSFLHMEGAAFLEFRWSSCFKTQINQAQVLKQFSIGTRLSGVNCSPSRDLKQCSILSARMFPKAHHIEEESPTGTTNCWCSCSSLKN